MTFYLFELFRYASQLAKPINKRDTRLSLQVLLLHSKLVQIASRNATVLFVRDRVKFNSTFTSLQFQDYQFSMEFERYISAKIEFFFKLIFKIEKKNLIKFYKKNNKTEIKHFNVFSNFLLKK